MNLRNNAKRLDDSGFGDANESIICLDDSIDNEVDGDIILVDDSAFDIIESSLDEILIDDSNDDEQDETIDCEASEVKTPKRKRGRPRKNRLNSAIDTEVVDLVSPSTQKETEILTQKLSLIENDDFRESDYEEDANTETVTSQKRKLGSIWKDAEVTTPSLKKRRRPRTLSVSTDYGSDADISTENQLSDFEDDAELLLADDEAQTPVRRKSSRIKKPKKSKPAAPSYDELTPYEKIRADNIREREEMLKALGIKEALDEYKSDVGLASKPQGSSRKTKERDRTELRRSSRLEGKEDVDYVPDEDLPVDDDPSDHTHDGLRKHPCKECANCMRPDCRRCIFCKDKRKYGGPNIKKQKCEYKEKCSQPIVICFICQGKRVFSCLACDKQFHESFQLEEHNNSAHGSKQAPRRSARLSEKF